MRYYFLIISFLIPVAGISQELKNVIGKYDVTNYSVQAGLVNSTIEWIEQDSKGNLWIATHGGVSCFDGRTFKNYTVKNGLPYSVSLCVKEAPDGKIWVGTHKGLACIDGEKVTAYTEKQGLYHSQVWRLAFDNKGDLYIGTSKGINVMKNGKILPFLNPGEKDVNKNVIRGLFFDSKGDLWYSTNAQLFRYSKGKSEWIADSGMNLDILEDKNGDIWFCGWEYNLARYKNGKVEAFSLGTPVNGIELDKNGNIWGACWEKGLVKFDGKKAQFYQAKNGLTINSLWGLKIDSEGNVWLGTFGGGLDKFSGERFVQISKADGLVNDVINDAAADSKGNLWIATEVGVSKFNYSQSSFLNFLPSDGLKADQSTGLSIDKKDQVWVTFYSGPDGLKKIVNDKVTNEKLEGGGFSVYADDTGFVWMGTDGGGLQATNGKVTKQFLYGNFHGDNRVLSCWKDEAENIFWLIPYSGGLLYYENGKINGLRKKEEFTNANVHGLIRDKEGKYWISAGENIYHCSFENRKLKILDSLDIQKYFGQAEGVSLSYNENKNEIWVGTSTGIARFSLRDFYSSKKVTLQFYTRDHGFKGGDCKGVLFHEKGKAWILTSNGLWLYQEEFDLAVNDAPQILISGIRLFREVTDWANLGYKISADGLPEYPELKYNQNNISFDFKGIFLSAPHAITYQYKLEGFDSDWQPETKVDEVTYSNLPPGEYTFSVKAKNLYGYWSEPVSYNFVIHPAFWQTIWFRIALVVFILISIAAFMRWRNRKLNRMNKILEEKVSERTARLQNAYELIEEKNKDITDSLNYASKIQQSILPDKSLFEKHFAESFVLFLPRDIVSGDFYFAVEENGNLYIAVADCTGHGVPGAMVSMVCSNALKKAIKEFKISDPGAILDAVAEMVEASFSVHNEQMRDGMDISLLVIDKKENKIRFAGANNPAWLLRENSAVDFKPQQVKSLNEGFFEIPANNQPIGIYADRTRFSTVEWDYQKGDKIYLFSDGFTDQFGGKGGKKYKYSRMRDFVWNNRNRSLNIQLSDFKSEFENWKGSLEQLDDICIVGLVL